MSGQQARNRHRIADDTTPETAMAKSDVKSVDDYLLAQPEASRAALERVRGAIRAGLPDAQEVISYKIPAYRLPGGIAIYFAGWTDHYALYPVSERTLVALGGDLANGSHSESTIRFALDEPVPVQLIERIARLLGEQTTGNAKPGPRPSARRLRSAP